MLDTEKLTQLYRGIHRALSNPKVKSRVKSLFPRVGDSAIIFLSQGWMPWGGCLSGF